ncbi:MAG: S8 family serine peptidase [Caulobacteraceae bacterium]
MTTLGERFCQLESGSGSGRLLDAYDAASDSWAVPFEGDFWSAVAHAHALGERGQGRRIAVIDTACDTTIPALAARIDNLVRIAPRPLGAEDTSHGTAVALLIARVAPQARLDIYAVAREDGRIDAADVAFAIETAAASDAVILNISLGTATAVTDLSLRLQGLAPALAAAYDAEDDALLAKSKIADILAPDGECRLCAAALAASLAGKMVFAAAGNDGAQLLCPSRSAGAVAGGFQSEAHQIVPLPGSAGETETASSADPHAPQSVFNDIALRETDGVLGTSFASPLIAGAAALAANPHEISGYVGAVRPAYRGSADMTLVTLGEGDREKLVASAHANFQRAMRLLPHVHSGFEAFLRNGPPGVSPPAACATCGLFAHAAYVNHGLLLLGAGALAAAESLLGAAVALFPWSAEAAANYGRTLQEMGDLTGALSQYDRALALRPGFPVYLHQRAVILDAMARPPSSGPSPHASHSAPPSP